MKWLLAGAALLIAIALVSIYLPADKEVTRSGSDKPLVVCSTTQIYDFARNVAADLCDIQCILGAGANPHTYSPTPRDASLVLAADLCLQNGLNLEGKNWMSNLAHSARKPLVTCTDGIATLTFNYEGETVSDPHAWFTPANAAIYVSNISKALIELDPINRHRYSAHAKLYLSQLSALDSWIRLQFNAIPPQRRILVTSHDAFNYFANEYGFKNTAPVGWSTGSESGGGMTPSRRTAVINSIRGFGVKAVFVETSVNPKMIREIAREAGVKIGGSLYSDAMGVKDSAGETYIGMMRENVMTIVSALRGDE